MLSDPGAWWAPAGHRRQSCPGGGELSGQCLVLLPRLQGRGGGRPPGGTAAGLTSRPSLVTASTPPASSWSDLTGEDRP